MTAEKLLTPEQVAEELQLSLKTVGDYLRRGVLPGIKIGRHWRIPEKSLQDFIDRQKAGE